MDYQYATARFTTVFALSKIVESGRECHVDGVTQGWTTNVASLLEDVFAVDDAVLSTRFADDKQHAGWVLFIPSNGEDVISDYSLGIEEIIDPVIAALEID